MTSNATMMNISILLLIFVIFPTFTLQNQYCAITKQHTLCKFQGISPKCKTPHERGIPSSDRNLIMDMHNTLRAMVATGNERKGRPGPQPQAANMKQMEWDEELAATAQRLADQCKYTHDCLECRKVSRFLTGQNLYQFSENIVRKGADWNTAIRAWYDEVAEWSPRHIDKFHFIKPLGHYTQMLWAETNKIGCGYSYFNDGKWNRKLYICNYGPTGNIITLPMYERGAPCSNCPDGTSCSSSYAGLCSAGGRGGGSSSFISRPAPTLPPPPPRMIVTYATTPRPTTTYRPQTTRQSFLDNNEIGPAFDTRFNRHQSKNTNRFSSSINTLSFTTERSNRNSFNSFPQQQQRIIYPTSTTTTTTPRAITFSPRVHHQQQDNKIINSNINYRIQTTPAPQFQNGQNGADSEQTAQTRVYRTYDSQVSKVRDQASILLFCDFDYAKCPIRFTGEPWNYTEQTTPGFGRGFESIIAPQTLTNLYIRSIMYPSNDGRICLKFRYILYIYDEQGRKVNSNLNNGISLQVTAGTLKQKPKIIELTEQSHAITDWLTTEIEFSNLKSMFLLIFQMNKSPLMVDYIYLGIDDILVTQGRC